MQTTSGIVFKQLLLIFNTYNENNFSISSGNDVVSVPDTFNTRKFCNFEIFLLILLIGLFVTDKLFSFFILPILESISDIGDESICNVVKFTKLFGMTDILVDLRIKLLRRFRDEREGGS